MQMHTETPVKLPTTHRLNFYIPPNGFSVCPLTNKHIVILKRRDASVTGQDEIPMYVEDLMPPDREPRRGRNQGLLLQSEIWGIVKPAYDAFVKGHETPEAGTPLGAFPHLNAASVTLLREMGYRSVEEIAEMSSEAAAKLPLVDGRSVPKIARAFLENKTSSDRDRRIHTLEETIASLQAELERRNAVDAAGGGGQVAEGAVPTQGAAANSKPVTTLGVVHLSIRQCAKYWGTTNPTISKKLKAGQDILDQWCAQQVRDRHAQGIPLPEGMSVAVVEAWEASRSGAADAAPLGGTEAAEGAGSAERAPSLPPGVELASEPLNPALRNMEAPPDSGG